MKFHVKKCRGVQNPIDDRVESLHEKGKMRRIFKQPIRSSNGIKMAHSQSDLLEIRYTKDKGRGVFARKDIVKGTVIERVPLIIVTWDKISESELGHYAYCWTEKKAALAMGYGSLYNHSFKPNAYYEDVGRQTKVFTAHRDITAGEEVTINYNGDPDDVSNELGFDVVD